MSVLPRLVYRCVWLMLLALNVSPAHAEPHKLPDQKRITCHQSPTLSELVVENLSPEEIRLTCSNKNRGLPVGYVYYVQEQRPGAEWATVACSTQAKRRSPEPWLPATDRLQDVYPGQILCEGDTLITWQGARVVVRTVSAEGNSRENLLLGEMSRLTMTTRLLTNEGGTVTLYAEPGEKNYRLAIGRKGYAEVKGTVVRVEVEDACTGEGNVSVVDQQDEAIHQVRWSRPGRLFWQRAMVGEGEVWGSEGDGLVSVQGKAEGEVLDQAAENWRQLTPAQEQAREEQPAVPSLWDLPPGSPVLITVKPRDAQVWIDGRPQQTERGKLTAELATGGHNLWVQREGYIPYDKPLQVGQTPQKAKVELVKVQQQVQPGGGEGTSAEDPETDPSTRELTGGKTSTPQEFERRRELLGMEFITIHGGTFMMGSSNGAADEKPPHPVTVSTFRMGKTEVTVAQYQACVNSGVCTAPDTGTYCNYKAPGRDNHPVNCVDHTQATAFAQWVGGTLPTEAQWEFAARGPEGRKYPWGNTPEPSCELAVFNDSGQYLELAKMGCGTGATASACSSPKGNTPDGLCDMAGNVWEWTEDWYSAEYYDTVKGGATDPGGPTSGSRRVMRGGSWGFVPAGLRASFRGGSRPTGRDDGVGFRLALPPGPDAGTPLHGELDDKTAPDGSSRGAAKSTPSLDLTSPTAHPVEVPSSETNPERRRQALNMEFIALPRGTSTMGSNDGETNEKPPHPVTVSAFRMGKTEVTNAQYQACVDAGGCTAPGWDKCFVYDSAQAKWAEGKAGPELKGANQPVVCVDHTQATTFAKWVGGTLPTEAQWEFAARGEAGRKYPWGNTPEPSCELAVYNSTNCGNSSTAPVCSKTKGNTPEGLCDMAGNVWEWTADWYSAGYYKTLKGGATDPTGPSSGSLRVLRGGSWFFGAVRLRGAYRSWHWPVGRYDDWGFRVVLPPAPPVTE